MLFVYRGADGSASIATHSCWSTRSWQGAEMLTATGTSPRCFVLFSKQAPETLVRYEYSCAFPHICEANVTRWHGCASTDVIYVTPPTPRPPACICPPIHLSQLCEHSCLGAAVNQAAGWSSLKYKLLFWEKWGDSPGWKSRCDSRGTWACWIVLPMEGGAQGPLPLRSVEHPLLLILTLKLPAITRVARLSRLFAKLRHSAVEVLINEISKPVITSLNMWPRAQARFFSVWVMLSVDCV